jgi:hypothetical protein
VLIELKKCCNHPFLFESAEENYRGDEHDKCGPAHAVAMWLFFQDGGTNGSAQGRPGAARPAATVAVMRRAGSARAGGGRSGAV